MASDFDRIIEMLRRSERSFTLEEDESGFGDIVVYEELEHVEIRFSFEGNGKFRDVSSNAAVPKWVQCGNCYHRQLTFKD